jgi:beta-galactosidase
LYAYLDTSGVIKVIGDKFSLEFDKSKGTFCKIEENGENLLRENGGPMLHLWRAPHQKDDMWAYHGWDRNGLKELTWTANDLKYTQVSPGAVEIVVNLTGTGKQNFIVRHHVVYTVYANGTINAENEVNFSDPTLILARIGIRMFLNKGLDRLDYFGRGPMENYADRKQGSDIAHYFSSIAGQMTPYAKPMDCGNHEDVRWANLTSEKGLQFSIKADSSLMQVSALPYSDEEMEPVEYRIDLPKSKGTVLVVSHKTLGVGSWGCGPKPLEQYRVYAKPTTFSYQIQLFSKNPMQAGL